MPSGEKRNMRKKAKHEWSELTHHSRINFIIFALLFAVIGGYIITNSFAATTNVTCDLFAAPSGVDGSTISGSISAPFKTVQYLDSRLSPGQTGCLRAGIYGNKTTATHVLNKNGTPTAQITIRSYPGELAEIDGFIEMGGANNSGQYTTLSYLKINGTNTLDNSTTTYTQCLKAPDGSTIPGRSQGLQINGTGDIFEYNELTQDSPYRANAIGVGWQVSGANWTPPNNAVIRNNKLHSIGYCADEDHLVYLAHGDNVQIYNNWMWDNPHGWGVQLYPAPTNAKIYNNVIDSAGSGFVIGDTGGVTSGNQIYHNIVVNSTGISNPYIGWAGFPGAMLSCSSSNSASTNNLVHDNISFNNPSGINYDCSTTTATLSNNVTTDPLFADANYKTSHDYRLATNSPAASWGLWDGDLGSGSITPPVVPSTPTGLVAIAGNASVTINWNANPSGDSVTTYNVYRTDTSITNPWGIVQAPTTTFTNASSATNGTRYCYVIDAQNAVGKSSQTAQVCATPTAPSTKTGDLNTDGVVNVFDLSILLSNYGKTTSTGDLNNDTVVNIFDLSILLSNYGK